MKQIALPFEWTHLRRANREHPKSSLQSFGYHWNQLRSNIVSRFIPTCYKMLTSTVKKRGYYVGYSKARRVLKNSIHFWVACPQTNNSGSIIEIVILLLYDKVSNQNIHPILPPKNSSLQKGCVNGYSIMDLKEMRSQPKSQLLTLCGISLNTSSRFSRYYSEAMVCGAFTNLPRFLRS